MLEEENNLQGQLLFFHSIIINLQDSYSPGKTVDTPKKKKKRLTVFKDNLRPSAHQGQG